MLRRFFTAFFLLLFLSLSVINADSFFDTIHLAYNGSILFFAADNGRQGSDPPAILPSMGVSVAWQFHKSMRLELTEDLYFTNYEYNVELDYPMACNPENRSAFVLGFVTGIQLTGIFPIKDEKYLIRVFGGPVFDLRLVTLAFGLNHPADFTGDIRTDPKLQTEAIKDYFWSNGRMFLFSIGAGMDFPLNEKFNLGFDLRTWMPLYRLWTNEDIPAIDGWRFGAGVRITPVK